jgi:hypothetical protein
MQKLTSLIVTGCFGTCLAIFSSAGLAQWDPFLRDVPLLPDGSPDMNAPAPRKADGTLDLSGTWNWIHYNPGGVQGRSVGVPVEPPPGVAPYATFWDQGFGYADGLPYQDWAREERERRVANFGVENPDSHCLPLGHMQFHTHNQPREIIQSEDRLIILYEASAGVREIFLDGRSLPEQGSALPYWYGYSVGHWEGDTLVVVSNNFRDNGWLDFYGSPTTDKLFITERFNRPTYGKLEIDIIIEDPGAYTEPFGLRVDQAILPGEQLIEWVCENEQSVQYFNQ